MKSVIKLITIVSLMTLLASCAISPQRKELSLQDRNKINSNTTLLNTAQKGIKLESSNIFNKNEESPYDPMDSGAIVKNHYGAVGPGLLDMAVSIGIHHYDVKKSKNDILQTRNMLANFNYINYFQGCLKTNLSGLPWLHLTTFKVKNTLSKSENDFVNSEKNNSVLFIGTTYYLSAHFNRLEVSAYTKLDLKQPKGKTPKMIYKNNFYYIYTLNGNTNDAQKNKSAWTKNNGYLLENKLRDAAKLLSINIAKDINDSNPQPHQSFGKIITLLDINGFHKKARILFNENGYSIASLSNGNQIYIINSAGVNS